MALIELAADVMTGHGWSTRRQSELAMANVGFDLVAENETAIAFFSVVHGHSLRARADALAGAIGAITLRRDAGVKAWEAYLLLLVEDDYAAADPVAQQIQRDLDYCRKIVLDGAGITAADNPPAAMERALSFLFPLDVALAPSVEDVRTHLVDLIVEKGFNKRLVAELVGAFDRETDCKCWERVKNVSPEEAAE
jgi:hypothetical protein